MRIVEDFVNQFPKEKVLNITPTYITIGGVNCIVRLYYSGRVQVKIDKKYTYYNVYRDSAILKDIIEGKKPRKRK